MPRQLIVRPVLARNPQNYIGDTPEFDALTRAAERAILAGDIAAVPSLLRALGVSHVVVRADVDFDSPVRTLDMVRPEPLVAGMDRLPGAVRSHSGDMGTVWEIDQPGNQPVQAYGGLLLAVRRPRPTSLPALVAGAPEGYALTSVRRWTRGRGAPRGADRLGRPTSLWCCRDRASGPSSVRPNGPPLQRIVVRDVCGDRCRGAIAVQEVVLQDAVRTTIDGAALLGRPDRVLGRASDVLAVEVDGTLLPLDEERPVSVRARSGSSARIVRLGEESALAGFGAVGDCHRYDGRTLDEVGIRRSDFDGPTGPEIELQAQDHAACVFGLVEGSTASTGGFLSVEIATVAGVPARVCLWMNGPNRCATVPAPVDVGDGWRRIEGPVSFPSGVQSVALYLYADGGGDGTTTVTRFRDASVRLLEWGDPVDLTPTSPVSTALPTLSAGEELEVRSTVDVPTPQIGAPSPLGDCARPQGEPEALGRMAMQENDGEIRLSASEHAACTSMPIDGLEPGVPYQLRIDARTLQGRGARACVWDRQTRRCLVQVHPPADPEWRAFEGTFTVDATQAESGLRLYLYAHAIGDGRTTEANYRSWAVSPVVDEHLVFTRVDAERNGVPSLRWERSGPAAYDVEVRGAAAPFVLALSDAWSPDWVVTGLPRGAAARQIMLDGYRNGWVIHAEGDFTVQVQYAPARAGRLALKTSVATLAALAFVPVLRPRHRRRQWVSLRVWWATHAVQPRFVPPTIVPFPNGRSSQPIARPQFTVVVPTRNAARTIVPCLASIRSQHALEDDTLPVVMELVVVDNGSTDGTEAIVRSWADVFESSGPERSAQRNTGAAAGRAPLVAFIDADMVLEPTVLAEAERLLDADHGLGLVIVPEVAFGRGFWARCRVLEKHLSVGNPKAEAARVYRRSAFEQAGGWDPALTAAEDWDLHDRVLLGGLAGGPHPALGSTTTRDACGWRTATARSATTAGGSRRMRADRGRGPACSVPGACSDDPRCLLRHPLLTIGLVVLKSVELAGASRGARDAAGRARPAPR
jgi:hypothetical protein